MFLQVIGIGRLPQDPELEYTSNGTAKVEFAIVDDQTHEDDPQFVNVIDWGESAENHAEYLEKGSMVAVIGGLDLGKWKDNDDNTRFSPQILAGRYGGRVVYLGGGSGNGSQQGGSSDTPEESSSDDDEDIPF